MSAHNSGLELVKYQALGNDYLLLDAGSPRHREQLAGLRRRLARLCDRHLGVGADGLLVFEPAEMRLTIFNPDGSEAEKSGNGLRIAACHAVLEYGAGERFSLRTQGGDNPVVVLHVAGPEIVCEVDVGPPAFEPDGWVELETPAGVARCRLVDVGNPHCVVLNHPVTPERCRQVGPALERHPRFPGRTNVQLAEAIDRGRVRAEIWERGAGYTLASGTSACAVAAALIRLDLVEPDVEVTMPGGSLRVRQDAGGHLLQTGPARRVFRAALALAEF